MASFESDPPPAKKARPICVLCNCDFSDHTGKGKAVCPDINDRTALDKLFESCKTRLDK